ncbi:MAG: FlgD immunoglobulin-like domain containing protein [Gaiellaceae bacterium]
MRRSTLLAVLALALIAATAAAFAWTESLKLERLPVVGPRFPASFSPICVCPTETAKLRLRFRVNDTVDAEILDADGEEVRSLGERRVRPGLVTFEWDGRSDEGRIVPDGPYRLKVELEDKRRTIVIPNRIFVDTVPPEVVDMRATPIAFSPDGDGRADVVRVAYRADGPAGPLLYVGDQLAVDKPARRARSAVIWKGTIDGELLSPGSYRLTLRVRDPAGNLSPESERVTVELRYITLSAGVFRVRPGGLLTFGVDTDAQEWSWRLQRLRGGKLRKVVLGDEGLSANEVVRLSRRELPAGRYQLQAYLTGENPADLPRFDTALVIVARR